MKTLKIELTINVPSELNISVIRREMQEMVDQWNECNADLICVDPIVLSDPKVFALIP